MERKSSSIEKSRKKDKSSKKDHKKKRDRSRSKDRKKSNKEFKHKKRDYLEDEYQYKRSKSRHDKDRNRQKSRSRSRSDSRSKKRRDDNKNNRQDNYKGLSYKERKIQQREKERLEDEQALLRYREQQQQQKDKQQENEKNSKKKEKNGDDQEQGQSEGEENGEEIEKPNYEATGLLAAEQNTVNGAVLKFTEPQDAAEPTEKWRLYCYKGAEELPTIHLKGSSVFLCGKDLRIADIQLLNNSCSAQHAVIQFREKRSFDEMTGEYNSSILPYIMDLESTNGTKLNGVQIEGARYYQLFEKDLIQFGFSDREYLLMKVNQ
ncbi:SMAD/FHA domain [Pseudocohnilembus persalinus]|uniref:SMAD/FHA domain n=1 Tax=Pseudocohnilembus persalinus TaxID=266149 RepID=A0A0V0QHI5_PSEPJ|nr:SMAD/FHA domain [Pseudocohnilembus persalinus]|eukprot:KRX01525.1 SMAD/FHA domain [Pseudocohnilembus persalinus]